jgi:hypothetical protein
MRVGSLLPRSAALLVFALLGARSAGAMLCAADDVPAATLLFLCTGRYAAGSTASDPVADRSAPTTTFSVTNVSPDPRIVNFVLHNDFGVEVTGWSALLTGYDVVTFDFGRILEGYLTPTGPAVDPSTVRPYSPTGSIPEALGPFLAYGSVPDLAPPRTVGSAPGSMSSVFGLCTNPTYTTPYTVDPGAYASRIPAYNRVLVYNAMRKSQVIAENLWWGDSPPLYVAPDWLKDRSTADAVRGFVTADLVDACTFDFPSSLGYFTTFARPVTHSYYGNNVAAGLDVALGNSLLGEWTESRGGDRIAVTGSAVSIEADNQDVANHFSYPKLVRNGTSFYRYSSPECRPAPLSDDLVSCIDLYTGSGIGSDHTAGATYLLGNGSTLPSSDFREPLPTAFAFRWLTGSTTTKLRVWKETPDIYPYYGLTYVYAGAQYTYYAWDDEERVVTVPPCPVLPCEPFLGDVNELPLAYQEVDVSVLQLPTENLGAGWVLLAFPGSNTWLLPVVGGYSSPFPETYGQQAFIEVEYTAGGRSQVVRAAPLGNYLCDGLAVTGSAYDRPDLGNVLY